MEINAEIKFVFSYYHPRRKEITLTLKTPEQTLKTIKILENAGFFISSEIIVMAQIANCIFKKTFCIRRFHSKRSDDFKNFRHAFNI